MLLISIYAGMHPCFNQTKKLFNALSYAATRRIVKTFLGAVRHYGIKPLAKKKTKPWTFDPESCTITTHSQHNYTIALTMLVELFEISELFKL